MTTEEYCYHMNKLNQALESLALTQTKIITEISELGLKRGIQILGRHYYKKALHERGIRRRMLRYTLT